MVLFRSSLSTGISGLSKFHDSHRPADRVDTVSLAEALVEHGIGRVEFLKVDTEGHDLFVLRGIDWERCAPSTIMCEFEDLKTRPLGYDYDALARYLTDRGYHVIVSEWYPVRSLWPATRMACVRQVSLGAQSRRLPGAICWRPAISTCWRNSNIAWVKWPKLWLRRGIHQGADYERNHQQCRRSQAGPRFEPQHVAANYRAGLCRAVRRIP